MLLQKVDCTFQFHRGNYLHKITVKINFIMYNSIFKCDTVYTTKSRQHCFLVVLIMLENLMFSNTNYMWTNTYYIYIFQ